LTHHFLLIGPYDPHGGEYTFLAPPLGVWRLAGYLDLRGVRTTVFDPNILSGDVAEQFIRLLQSRNWDLIGVSTTAMTLRYDLQLAHLAKQHSPRSLLIAGGMEATFNPERIFELGPFDLVVLGEGEKPLAALAERLRSGTGTAGLDLAGVAGTALKTREGQVVRFHQTALTADELRDAVAATPYERMPYPAYWNRLERAYQVGALPFKADREARLSEIRSVRLNTLNYCPMACSFCSSTNFLHAAQGSTARVARLESDACLHMIRRILAAHPGTRTILFQDDIFVFTQDKRLMELCAAIVAAKANGQLPASLEFISTNRIDSMTPERLAAMRQAGFRVLGFGIESFAPDVLREFNKEQIHRHIEPVLQEARRQNITPFLDLILTSPRSTLADFALTVREAFRWIEAGCEVGVYPYVIPFTGSAFSRDPTLKPQTVYETVTVPGTTVSWRHAAKILPVDPEVRAAILAVEARFEHALESLSAAVPHLPSRVRSLLWIACAEPTLREAGQQVPEQHIIQAALLARLPGAARARTGWLESLLALAQSRAELCPALRFA
jgi:radical SAM superfamily enzyme YgiQ (UPF0313 family)